MKAVDNRGLSCPQPVVNTKKALEELTTGAIVSIVDNVVARENVLKYARSQGYAAEFVERGEAFYITIARSDATLEEAILPTTLAAPAERGLTLYLITSDQMGGGAALLGNALMKTFFYALSESTSESSCIVFLNSGAQLACGGSPVLESLKKLKNAGWGIMTCGTCLDFYGLKDTLSIGEVTNMYAIVELMQRAAKVVTL